MVCGGPFSSKQQLSGSRNQYPQWFHIAFLVASGSEVSKLTAAPSRVAYSIACDATNDVIACKACSGLRLCR